MASKDKNGVSPETKELFKAIKRFQSRRPSAKQSTESTTQQENQKQAFSSDESSSDNS